MNEPTLYRKTSIASINNKATFELTTDEQTRVNTVITKFFELFTTKHM